MRLAESAEKRESSTFAVSLRFDTTTASAESPTMARIMPMPFSTMMGLPLSGKDGDGCHDSDL